MAQASSAVAADVTAPPSPASAAQAPEAPAEVRRRDPEDGRSYIVQELREKLHSQFSEEEIQQYWEKD
eukprot:11167459-Lingulodinium_polyedra.AAC.1